MPQNLEMKAIVRFPARLPIVLRRLHARFAEATKQIDTYFILSPRRLKIREATQKPAELIWYHRPDRSRQRYSDYRIIRLRRASETKRMLSRLFGRRAIVRKLRRVYMYKNARIHLDRVSGLGEFLEFEVLVRKGKRQAEQLMRFLIKTFDIRNPDRISGSYSDLLLETKGKRRNRR